MKKITAFILTFVLMFTLSVSVVYAEVKPTGMVYGKIVQVHDGDSFSILTQDNKLYKFKISGINTSKNPDAYTFLNSYLKGKNARVMVQNIPSANLKAYSYGVVIIDNVDIAKPMLQLGYASVNTSTCTPDNKNIYSRYENTAKQAEVGIWGF